jgi:hypothetical protein
MTFDEWMKQVGRGKLVKITVDKLQKTDSGPTQLTQSVEALFAAHHQRTIARGPSPDHGRRTS